MGRVTGQEILKNITGIDKKEYLWGKNDRLLWVNDNGSERHFEYDKRGYLTRTHYADGSTDIRVPDNTGNLYETLNKSDRKYAKGGQLVKTQRWEYKYDDLGNLIRKKDKKGQTWRYEWNAAGMLKKVKRPDSAEVTFTYDALGRRIEKRFNRTVTKWVWDGNVPLHEWKEIHSQEYEPEQGSFLKIEKQAVTTWLFEEGTFVPAAKLTDSRKLSIVSNYMGTPEAMYDSEGKKSWGCELNSFGKVRNYEGQYKTDCPFRYQGQYEDAETGLYYNRFRYYSPEEGIYISQDPIGLSGGRNFYSYVHDTNRWIDIWGLEAIKNKVDGCERERIARDRLRQEHPNAIILGERDLRDSNGKRVKDTETKTGRRVDFVVIEDGKVVRVIEVTSPTADKVAQFEKEGRIKEDGGTFIREPKKRGKNGLYDISGIDTERMNIDLEEENKKKSLCNK